MRSLLLELLRVVTVPHWRRHWLRTMLTMVGVALGVATVVAVSDVSASVLASFRRMVATLAGDADLEITRAGATVDEALADRIRDVPDVAAVTGLVESFVTLADRPAENLYVLGVDFLDSPVWRTQLPRERIDIPDTLEFLAQGDSVVVSDGFAQRLGLRLGDPLAVVAPDGPRTLRVRGLLRDVPAAQLFDGAVALMDLPRAQALLGRGRRVDRLVVQTAPGASPGAVRDAIAARLPPGTDVMAPESRGRQTEQLLTSLRSMLVVAGSLAVIVGALIVYQAVAVSVEQRRRQFALLNAVGVQRRTLVALCLVETATVALAGSGVGLVAGRVLARLAGGVVGAAASEIWLHLDVTEQVFSGWGTALALAVGLGIALVAAGLAVRSTFVAPTVEALRPAGVAVETVPRRGRATAIAAALVAATWTILLVPPNRPWLVVTVIVASQMCAYLGAAVWSPSLVFTVGRGWRRLTAGSYRLPLRLAADNVPRTAPRAGMTVVTITAAIGMTASLGGFVQSFEAAWMGWAQQHFASDLFVGSGARFHLLAGPPMGPEVAAAVAATDGVVAVEPFRVLRTRLGDEPVFVQSVAVTERLRHGGLPMVEGDLAVAAPFLEAGTGVLVSDNLAYRLGLHRGDVVPLATPHGDRAVRVEGTFVDYLGSLDQGAIAVDAAVLARDWDDRSANLLRIWLQPGADLSGVRAALLAKLGSGYYVISARQFLDAVQTVWNQFFVAAWGLVVVAIGVSVIGVVNAQLASVIDRAPELSMLHTIGVSARDLVRAVVIECGAVALIGGVFGLALGTMLSAQFVTVSMRRLTGWRLPFELPLGPLLCTVAAAVTLSAIVAWMPARATSRALAPTSPE